ncbi:hypothetical protein BH24ACT4_BH24ACT4_03420 [soil metagenome]
MTALAALVLVVGMGACTDEREVGGGGTTDPSTTSLSTTTDGDGDDTAGTGGGPAPTTVGTNTTTDGGGGSGSPLSDRLPEVPDFARSESGEESIPEQGLPLCDGGTSSVDPVSAVAVEYDSESIPALQLDVLGLELSSAEDAQTLYDEYVASTAGCVDEDRTIDEDPVEADIGDEAVRLDSTSADGPGPFYLIARRADTVWVLGQENEAQPEDATQPVVDAFTAAVEG